MSGRDRTEWALTLGMAACLLLGAALTVMGWF